MDSTTQRDLREIDQRIAALNISLNEQLSALNMSIHGRLQEIKSDLEQHRWQTHYYRRTIIIRLAKLEANQKAPRFQFGKIMDSVIIMRLIVLVGLAATGMITWAEVGKLVMN